MKTHAAQEHEDRPEVEPPFTPAAGPYRQFRFCTNDDPLGAISPPDGSLETAIELARGVWRMPRIHTADDVAVWHEGHLCAVLRPIAGGELEVIRLDGSGVEADRQTQ